MSSTATTGMSENGVTGRHGEASRVNSLPLHGLQKDENNELSKSTLSSRVDAVSHVSSALEWIIRAICREELLKYGKFHVHDENENVVYRQVRNMMKDCQVQQLDNMDETRNVDVPENRESRTGRTKCYSLDKVDSSKRTEVDVEQDNERTVKKNKVYSNAIDVENDGEFKWYAGELNKRVQQSNGKNTKATLEHGKDEMNVPAQMLFGEDNVSAPLLLDTGAQRLLLVKNCTMIN